MTFGDGNDLAFVCSEIDTNHPSLFPDSRGAVVDGSDPSIAGTCWSNVLNGVYNGIDKSKERGAETEAHGPYSVAASMCHGSVQLRSWSLPSSPF